jgi:hypothetical protein
MISTSLVVGALVTLGIVGALGLLLKWAILRSVPVGIRYVETTPAEYPALDVNALERYTWHFSALGFVDVGDYRLEADSGVVQPGFARLFVHPTEGCYAEVNQIFPAKQSPIPMRGVIGTVFDDGWSLATTDRAADGIVYMMRRPRGLWQSMPDALVPDLFRAHVQRRDEMSTALGVRPRYETSRDAYLEHERAEAEARKESIRRKNIFVALAEIFLYPLRPAREWLGEYAHLAR